MQEQDRRQGEEGIGQRSRAGRLAAGAGLALGATLVSTGTAQAAEFTVINTDSSGPGSLRDAINQANANDNSATEVDRVLFQSGLSGTIHLNEPVQDGSLDVDEALEIVGPGADQLTVSADAQSRVFYIDTTNGDDVTISGLKVVQGQVKYGTPVGGNIASFGADLTVTNSVVRSGTAILGGGGISSNGDLTVRDSTVSGNVVNIIGGGIIAGYSQDAVVRITGSTIANNAAMGKYFGEIVPPPQGIAADGADATEPTQREGGGGGVFIGGDTIIENSTFSGNSAAGQGGAIVAKYGEEVAPAIRSTTISGNAAGSGGGIYSYTYQPNGSGTHPHVAIENSIVAGNEADGPGNGPDLAGGPFDASFSLIQRPSSVTLNETVAGSNIIGVDPLLAALDENGGTTRTMALQPASPAIDAGRTPAGETTDQRGESRPADLINPNSSAAGADGADMGAYELQGPPAPQPEGSCNGRDATVALAPPGEVTFGTAGVDVIVGDGGANEIRGRGGNDLICGRGGRDTLGGGPGNDEVLGEAGNDVISGDQENDTMRGGQGNDKLSGATGNDRMFGNDGQDRLAGAAGDDRLNGGANNDVLIGAAGDDVLSGGAGNDRLNGGQGLDQLGGGAGRDQEIQQRR